MLRLLLIKSENLNPFEFHINVFGVPHRQLAALQYILQLMFTTVLFSSVLPNFPGLYVQY